MRYEEDDIPGFVAAISYQGEILINEAYGYANVICDVAMTPQHIFRVASHSKTFTGTAIMMLAEEGSLRIDDVAVKYLPWLKKPQGRSLCVRDVTPAFVTRGRRDT